MPVADSKICIVPVSSSPNPNTNRTITKTAVSSLLRTHFSGSIEAYQGFESPLFSIARRQFTEKSYLPINTDTSPDLGSRYAMEFLWHLTKQISQEDDYWVVITHPAGIALRNIDHLFPDDGDDPYGRASPQFLWHRVRPATVGADKDHASQGIWAVRANHLITVVNLWAGVWQRNWERHTEEEIWTMVVESLPLRKSCFERDEIASPRIGSMDWGAAASAAFITVPDWPVEEQRRFLQALYYGAFLGDESGLMMNILEP